MKGLDFSSNLSATMGGGRYNRGVKASTSSASTSKFNINDKNLVEFYNFVIETITFRFLTNRNGGDTVNSVANATLQLCSKANVDSLRARDIRNVLIQKYSYNVNDINSILDKTELKAILNQICTEKMSTINSDIYYNYIVRFFIIVVFLQLLYLLRGLVYGLLVYSVNPIFTFMYQLRLKSKMAKDCIKSNYILALLSLVLSCLIDVAQQLMHIRVIVSWILPSYSFMSIWIKKLTPFVVSMPVSPQQLIGSRMPSVNMGGYGVDMGPIITIMLFNFIKSYCEEFTASKIIHITNKRNQKKHKKNAFMKSCTVTTSSDGDVNELFGMDPTTDTSNPYGRNPFNYDKTSYDGSFDNDNVMNMKDKFE